MISFNEIRGFFDHQLLQKELIVTSQIYEYLRLGVASLLNPNFPEVSWIHLKDGGRKEMA